MKSIRFIMTLLALTFGWLLRPSAAPPLRSRKNLSGDDYPERGEAKTWVIVALLSAAFIAVLLAISGPPVEPGFGKIRIVPGSHRFIGR